MPPNDKWFAVLSYETVMWEWTLQRNSEPFNNVLVILDHTYWICIEMLKGQFSSFLLKTKLKVVVLVVAVVVQVSQMQLHLKFEISQQKEWQNILQQKWRNRKLYWHSNYTKTTNYKYTHTAQQSCHLPPFSAWTRSCVFVMFVRLCSPRDLSSCIQKA